MTDYTQNTIFTPKDALSTGDPDKLILGAELDPEFGELQTAIATKHDSSDIATQAQAEAGTSNTVLMTPLRGSQFLSGGSSGGTALLLTSLRDLDDPGDDRIMYWDESVDAAAWLDIGTHLEITAGSVLNVLEGGIDHDALTNFVANEHVDHTTITITAGSGLVYSVGGTDIAADATIDLDLSSLTAESTIDTVNDTVGFYDNSAAANRKVSLDVLLGDTLGDGKWYRNTTQSIGASLATLVYNTAAYNVLERGTFSTSTGEYTAGADGARVQVVAHILIDAQGVGDDADMQIQVNGTSQASGIVTNRGVYGASNSTLTMTTTLNLVASDVVRVQAKNDSTKNISGGVANFNLSIIELG